jgi:ABC-type polysaccharide/polyol phosphate export permease
MTTIRPALSARHRQPPVHTRASWMTPLLLGIAYALYAAWVTSNNQASDARITTTALVGGAAVAVLSFLISRLQGRMSRRLMTASYAAVFGTATGYLISQSASTWLKAAFLGLFFGVGMGIVVSYIRYVREA